MFRPVDTRNSRDVQDAVQACYLGASPQGDREFVPKALEWIVACFTGRSGEYQAIDARYHDLEHTLQGTLCLSRLLMGRYRAKAHPVFSEKTHQLCILAMLFHDTGYLKKREDVQGTGAKYTPIHVNRSASFAGEFLSRQNYKEPDITAVQNMIRCTGVNVLLSSIPFRSDEERIAGFALGTADLLGQMAAPDYVDKLPTLYLELAEASRANPDWASSLGSFASAEDLIRNTPRFWSGYVWPRLNDDFQKLYCFLNDPYPDGPNPYLSQIEQNLARLATAPKK